MKNALFLDHHVKPYLDSNPANPVDVTLHVIKVTLFTRKRNRMRDVGEFNYSSTPWNGDAVSLNKHT